MRYLDKEKDIKFIKFTIPISKKGKKALAKKLNEMNVHKKYYRYSLLSAINCFYPKMPFCPKNKYTCLSFAVKILKDYGIIDPLITIYEIRKLHYLLKHFPHQVYRMSCSEKQNYEWGLDEYYNRQSILNHLPFVK
ncbi:MAG: hypothetical protein GX326_04550 [Clostridiaceae bacterium]|nr:hypothetical protein [Clostridiaceae bacterium]